LALSDSLGCREPQEVIAILWCSSPSRSLQKILLNERSYVTIGIILACFAHPVARLKDAGLFGTSTFEEVSF